MSAKNKTVAVENPDSKANETKERKIEIYSSDEYMIPLMFSLYQNALIREKQEKLDMATLLFYRLLEMSEQKRLADYGIVVEEPDYLSLSFKNKQSGLRSLLPQDREEKTKPICPFDSDYYSGPEV